jgi:hypothetical protein
MCVVGTSNSEDAAARSGSTAAAAPQRLVIDGTRITQLRPQLALVADGSLPSILLGG